MSSPPSFSGVPIVHFVRFHVFALLVPCVDVLCDFRVFTPICLVRGSCFIHVFLLFMYVYRGVKYEVMSLISNTMDATSGTGINPHQGQLS